MIWHSGKPRACLELVAITIPLLIGCGPSPKERPSGSDSHAYDLGAVPQGETLRFYMPIVNSRDEALNIASWVTTCECLTVRPKNVTIPSNSTGYVVAICSFGNEPDYKGDLKIDIDGYDEGGHSQITGSISVSVVPMSKLPIAE
jgi:hypothetical protein